MRESPVKALITLCIFYTVLLGAWFTFEAPEITLARIRTLTWLPWSHKIIEPLNHSLGLMDSFTLQKQVILLWSPLVLGLTLIAVFVGVGLTWKLRGENDRLFNERRKGNTSRGISSELGPVPELSSLPRKVAKITWTNYPKTNAAIEQMSPEERALFDQIIETLYYHNDTSYVGAGHGVTLLKHSLDALAEVAEEGFTDTLQLLAAIAHDMGKITAWKKIGKVWTRVQLHDKETAKILVTLPAFWEMPILRREALRLALKYDHSPSTLPLMGDPELERMVRFLLRETAEADQRATAQEKLEVLHAVPLEDQVMEAFMSALPDLQFNTPASQPGSKSDGWKKAAGSFDPPNTHTLYILEQNLRTKAMMYLPEDTRSALGGVEWRERGVVAPYTEVLLRELDKRGWLGKDVRAKPQRKNAEGVWEFIHKEPITLSQPPESAIWKILAGTSEFAGIIVIRLPDEEGMGLPMNDTKFGVFIQGPQFGAPPKASMDGLLGKARDVREAKQEKKQAAKVLEMPPAESVASHQPASEPVAIVVKDTAAPVVVLASVVPTKVADEVKSSGGQVISTEGTSLFKGGSGLPARGGRGRGRVVPQPPTTPVVIPDVSSPALSDEETADVLADLSPQESIQATQVTPLEADDLPDRTAEPETTTLAVGEEVTVWKDEAEIPNEELEFKFSDD